MGSWVFAVQRPGDPRRAPQEAVLFKDKQAREDEYAGTAALVREVLQNAIDAGAEGETVRVRFALHGPDEAPPTDRLVHYFARLRAPLGKKLAFAANGAPSDPCHYLVCEDFGTRGLEGDPRRKDDPPAGEISRQDFFWFWRNIGISGKSNDDLGRWGLGKTVYRAASRADCMFGLSIRRSDRQRSLMGQAVLQIHKVDGQEYVPEGYWCANRPDDPIPLPIDDPAEQEQFAREWHLSRRDEPGLSVVAPFVPAELKASLILKAVAIQFFARILCGDLVVEVSGPDLPPQQLDRHSLADICDGIEWNPKKSGKWNQKPPVSFITKCLNSPPSAQTVLLGVHAVPKWSDIEFADADKARLQERFKNGELIGVRVRIALPRREEPAVEGLLDAYLRQRGPADRFESYFVREGMTIVKQSARVGKHGVQSLVIVDKGPLAELLGDTEGPSHEEWETTSERPNATWKVWKGRVHFVSKMVDYLYDALTPPITEPNFDLLSDFFAVDERAAPQRQPRPGNDDPQSARLGDLEPSHNWYRIQQRQGGFTVSHARDAALPEKARLRVSCAYDLVSGDPLRHWSPFDFEIGTAPGQLPPRGAGVEAKRNKGNVVTLNNLQPEFRFEIDGFDEHRDLLVRVDDVSAATEVEA
ncbi:MAG: hypothetical protein K1X71_11265 [Pirellulales bacterium]|nr:hypothetical protein [Pirellulales bacterium]